MCATMSEIMVEPAADPRPDFLTSEPWNSDYSAYKLAWSELLRQWPVARAGDLPVRIPLQWLLRAGSPGQTPPPPSAGSQEHQPGPAHRSVVSALAARGADGLALRLLLAITAVSALAKAAGQYEHVSHIPLLPPTKPNAPTVSWAALTMLGPTRAQLRERRARPGKATARKTSQLRMYRAVRSLEARGLITVHRNRAGELASLTPAELPPPLPSDVRAGCNDAHLPLTFWLDGWNAVLWADEVIVLLMYSAAPPARLYADRRVLNNGQIVELDWSTHAREGWAPVGWVRFLSKSRRQQQFGVCKTRYRCLPNLLRLRIMKQVTTPVKPLAVRKALNAAAHEHNQALTRAQPAGTSDLSVDLSSLKTLYDEDAPAAAAAYTINEEAFRGDARTALITTFL